MGSDLLIVGVMGAAFVILNVIILRSIIITRHEVKQVAGWPSTQGMVMSSTVETFLFDDSGDEDHPAVKYSYQVGGQVFQSDRIAPGSRLRGWGAGRVVKRYPQGAPVVVFYNPQDPAHAVLEKKAPARNWLWWFILLVFDCVICGAAPLVWWALSQ